jgi:hypothetical protein
MEKTEQERLMNLAAEYEPERFAEITGGMMFVNTKENRRRAWVTIGYGEPGYTVYFFVHSAARGWMFMGMTNLVWSRTIIRQRRRYKTLFLDLLEGGE